ncbi:MAG: hypothetical protein IT324_20265 [Anaerolineae bacterium]|nr:hypothetical protein [Anaerolineae bacterium]
MLSVIKKLMDCLLAGWLGVLLTGCGSTVTTVYAPWRTWRAFSSVTPHDQPVLQLIGTTPLVAWPGDPVVTQLRLIDASRSNDPIVLPLGSTPRRVSLYPAGRSNLQILWLDETLPGESRLFSAILGVNRAVERGPNLISNRPTLDYSATLMPSGDLVVFWMEANNGPLYAQFIDTSGRPRPPLRLADSGRYPTAAYDQRGALHVAWVEPTTPRLWAIHYSAFADGLPAPVQGNVIGLITLDKGDALESFALGLDSTHVYCLWGTVNLNNLDRTWGKVAGLTFPFTNSAAIKTLTINAPNVSLRWLSLPPQQVNTLTIGLTASAVTENVPHEYPVTVAITPTSIGGIQPVVNEHANVIGKTTLTTDTNGNLYIAWTALRENGTAYLYYATTRP